LKALWEKKRVWQRAYGDDALEDDSMATWYQHRTQARAPAGRGCCKTQVRLHALAWEMPLLQLDDMGQRALMQRR